MDDILTYPDSGLCFVVRISQALNRSCNCVVTRLTGRIHASLTHSGDLVTTVSVMNKDTTHVTNHTLVTRLIMSVPLQYPVDKGNCMNIVILIYNCLRRLQLFVINIKLLKNVSILIWSHYFDPAGISGYTFPGEAKSLVFTSVF